MSEPYERTVTGRIRSVTRNEADRFEIVACTHGYDHTFVLMGDGSEWTPGQRVDVILRAVHEAKAEEAQDAD